MSQESWDRYNGFWLETDDFSRHSKFLTRYDLMRMVKDIPGDIVEVGVFKGVGLAQLYTADRHLNPVSRRRYLGFDVFEGTYDEGKGELPRFFSQANGNDGSFNLEVVEKRLHALAPNGKNLFHLVKGDIKQTLPTYVDQHPGFKAAMVYLDLDASEPTYHALKHLWNSVCVGGVIVFDEYALNGWSESKGVDMFLSDHGIDATIMKPTNSLTPTGYMVKTYHKMI